MPSEGAGIPDIATTRIIDVAYVTGRPGSHAFADDDDGNEIRLSRP